MAHAAPTATSPTTGSACTKSRQRAISTNRRILVFPNSPGPGTCREMGHKTPFDAAKIMELYGSRKAYTSRFAETVDRLVKERWLTEGDAKRLKQEVANSN